MIQFHSSSSSWPPRMAMWHPPSQQSCKLKVWRSRQWTRQQPGSRSGASYLWDFHQKIFHCLFFQWFHPRFGAVYVSNIWISCLSTSAQCLDCRWPTPGNVQQSHPETNSSPRMMLGLEQEFVLPPTSIVLRRGERTRASSLNKTLCLKNGYHLQINS